MIDYGSSQSKKQYTRRIGDSGFLGADFSTAPIFASDRRFRDLKNVWKDYKSGSGVAIETIPGFRNEGVVSFESDNSSTINNIFQFDIVSSDTDFEGNLPFNAGTWIGVHRGKELHFFRPYNTSEADGIGRTFCYVSDGEYKTITIGGGEPSVVRYRNGTFAVLPNEPSIAVQHGNTIIIFCDGEAYTVRRSKEEDLESSFFVYVDGGWYGTTELECGFFVEPINAYVPTTHIDGNPYEQKNMLSARSKERFTATVEMATDVWVVSSTIYPHEVINSGDSPYKSNILSVTVNGNNLDASDSTGIYTVTPDLSGNVESITVYHYWTSNPGDTATIEIEYVAKPSSFVSYKSFDDYKDRTTFNEGNPGYSGTAYDAITGCTICATFDERVFLAGNPELPNTVFYSQRDLTGYNNPTYFGVLNYNNLGTSNAPITAMIPSANALYVLKDDSSTDPTMYVLTGQTTEIDLLPRIYTVESGLPGIGCKGAACNFLDDIVFMSRNGVIGIDKQAVNLERTLGDRSALINGKLLLEDVTQAVFAEAEGYLWVLFKNNGHVYLADSRAYTQGAGYEWYFIDSVGSWKSTLANPEVDYLQYKDDIVGDEESVTIYDEDDTEHLNPYVVVPRHTDGEQALDEYGNPIESSATYTVNPDGVTHDIILVENPDPNHMGTYLQVEKTGEKVGGTFHPATCMVAANDRIFFGTDNGDLLTFNNDKRGVQAESEIVSGTTYGENRYPFLLRPEWYSFCGHRIESFVETSDDDGGIGNLTKDTVRRSCVVDMKAMLGSKYKITTYTDRDGWKNDNAATGSMNDASQTMLDAVNFSGDEHINVQIRERARKWVHKRYRIESDGFCSPFGLYRITYNFEINGRIK